ncbi:hypothetical protein [Streptomyces palmae]|uniref:Uncharacterized protein n=1 Tax=Streptomyces palmae TaxID=1701085 RepID=A0A4Z0HG05_9ACTN|nr:hypothetical protein [Streptomyces palmae]TGB17802.1 hypothetical protein E4099_02850 [Streptomyces palmae]
MTAPRLPFADHRDAADLAAFLARLIHYDRAAVVRLQAGGGVLAVFGRPPSFEVLGIRTAPLADAGLELDVTVSAGQLADALDAARASRPVPAAPSARVPDPLAVRLPDSVTGPPWAGVLPPRGGWRRVTGLPGERELVMAVGAAVAEFRQRDAALPEERRNRTERDRIGRQIWSRTLGDTGLPLRAVHAAQSLGFLRPAPAPAPAHRGAEPASAAAPGRRASATALADPAVAEERLVLFAAGGWLRLRTPYGSIAVRTGGPVGLNVSPV